MKKFTHPKFMILKIKMISNKDKENYNAISTLALVLLDLFNWLEKNLIYK